MARKSKRIQTLLKNLEKAWEKNRLLQAARKSKRELPKLAKSPEASAPSGAHPKPTASKLSQAVRDRRDANRQRTAMARLALMRKRQQAADEKSPSSSRLDVKKEAPENEYELEYKDGGTSPDQPRPRDNDACPRRHLRRF